MYRGAQNWVKNLHLFHRGSCIQPFFATIYVFNLNEYSFFHTCILYWLLLPVQYIQNVLIKKSVLICTASIFNVYWFFTLYWFCYTLGIFGVSFWCIFRAFLYLCNWDFFTLRTIFIFYRNLREIWRVLLRYCDFWI